MNLSSTVYAGKSREMEERWQRLCSSYLPVAPVDSVWRYSRRRRPHEPEQGWKLHISSTVLNAAVTLEKIAPVLSKRGVQFKAPSSLQELGKINSGLFYGYAQIGKTITVYPRTPKEAVSLARRLHELTRGMSSPQVPFDRKYRPITNVYYRYGAFTQLEIQHPDGSRTPAVRDQQGNLAPDSRESATAKPEWVSDLLSDPRLRDRERRVESPLATRFRVFRALTQRGKGGVYQAIDLGSDPPRLCLLKEGRRHGETRWDGCDGAGMIRNEARVLSLLRASGVEVPRPYSSFDVDGNFYLVTEFIDGENLQRLLSRLRKRILVTRALHYGIQLASFLSGMHVAGWAWRDCKPMNIIVTREDILRPLDFEGACPADAIAPMPWGTPGFSPPEVGNGGVESGVHSDLYALGALLYLLLTGRVPEAQAPLPIEKLRRNVPSGVREIVSSLLGSAPPQQPCAESVARDLGTALSVLKRQRDEARCQSSKSTGSRKNN